MASYDPEWTVRRSRAVYFQRAGFAADGGYGDKWVKLKAGRLTLAFPNTAARVRCVRLHDIHHVVTGYATTWTGEAEIAAWEIASGCAKHYTAWIINSGAFAIGLFIAPLRLFQAFVKGRRSANLYRSPFSDELLERTVGQLRGQFHIPDSVTPAPSDVAAFAVWSVLAVAMYLLPLAMAGAGAVLLWRRLSS